MLSLTGALTRNWTLKLSAFGLALLLWVAVKVEAPSVQDISGIPVRVTLSDSLWSLVDLPNPEAVTVRFEGPSRELIRIAMERPTLTIPLDEVVSADTLVVLNAAWVGVQGRQGVRVENIQPSSVRLLLEPLLGSFFPPALRFQGELPDTLAFAVPPFVEPGEIRVRGPQSSLAALDSIPLLPFDLSSVASSGVVSIQVDTTGLGGYQIAPLELFVHLQVEEKVTGSVSEVPVYLPGALREESEFLLRFPTATAILQGAKSVVEGADVFTLEFVVDTSGVALPGPGEEVDFPLLIQGLSPLLTGEARPDQVTVRNIREAGL